MSDEHETDAVEDPAFEALWARVLEAWDDDKPHHALINYAVTTMKLPEVAGRYRALTEDPEKAERAKKRLDGVVIAATHMMLASKTTAEPAKIPRWLTLLAFAVSALILGWLMYAVFKKR